MYIHHIACLAIVEYKWVREAGAGRFERVLLASRLVSNLLPLAHGGWSRNDPVLGNIVLPGRLSKMMLHSELRIRLVPSTQASATLTSLCIESCSCYLGLIADEGEAGLRGVMGVEEFPPHSHGCISLTNHNRNFSGPCA